MHRKDKLTSGNIFHIFDRGVNKQKIFFSEEDYRRFLQVATHYLTSKRQFSHSKKPISDTVSEMAEIAKIDPKVEVLGYCLMPNHFHLLVKQLVDRGITWYLQHVINSYSHYIHTKHKRTGPLFEGPFKNVLIETDEQLIHVSRYIHLNPIVSGLTKDLDDYLWTSYSSYISDEKDPMCKTKTILGYFKNKKEYRQFVLDQIDYGKELESIKHLTLD